jgi:hypothetical protein
METIPEATIIATTTALNTSPLLIGIRMSVKGLFTASHENGLRQAIRPNKMEATLDPDLA